MKDTMETLTCHRMISLYVLIVHPPDYSDIHEAWLRPHRQFYQRRSVIQLTSRQRLSDTFCWRKPSEGEGAPGEDLNCHV